MVNVFLAISKFIIFINKAMLKIARNVEFSLRIVNRFSFLVCRHLMKFGGLFKPAIFFFYLGCHFGAIPLT